MLYFYWKILKIAERWGFAHKPPFAPSDKFWFPDFSSKSAGIPATGRVEIFRQPVKKTVKILMFLVKNHLLIEYSPLFGSKTFSWNFYKCDISLLSSDVCRDTWYLTHFIKKQSFSLFDCSQTLTQRRFFNRVLRLDINVIAHKIWIKKRSTGWLSVRLVDWKSFLSVGSRRFRPAGSITATNTNPCFGTYILQLIAVPLRNVQISYDGFLSNFRPLPHMTVFWGFQPTPSPHMTFSANPLPPIYRKWNCELSFFSHNKNYMTVWP